MKNNVGGGSDVLLAGTMDHGWFGEVSASDFITGPNLAKAVGMGLPFPNPSDWLKFALNGKVLYVAMKVLSIRISWAQLNNAGLVFGQKTVVVNNETYKVRLLKGCGPVVNYYQYTGFDVAITHGSEWNRLMYHVAGKPFGSASDILTSEGIAEGDWAQYTKDQLETTTGSICQEADHANCYQRALSHLHYFPKTDLAYSSGWRPVLELVP